MTSKKLGKKKGRNKFLFFPPFQSDHAENYELADLGSESRLLMLMCKHHAPKNKCSITHRLSGNEFGLQIFGLNMMI